MWLSGIYFKFRDTESFLLFFFLLSLVYLIIQAAKLLFLPQLFGRIFACGDWLTLSMIRKKEGFTICVSSSIMALNVYPSGGSNLCLLCINVRFGQIIYVSVYIW